MSIYRLQSGSHRLPKRLVVFIAVVAFHVLIAGAFINGLARRSVTRHASRVIPVPVTPLGQEGLVPI